METAGQNLHQEVVYNATKLSLREASFYEHVHYAEASMLLHIDVLRHLA